MALLGIHGWPFRDPWVAFRDPLMALLWIHGLPFWGSMDGLSWDLGWPLSGSMDGLFGVGWFSWKDMAASSPGCGCPYNTIPTVLGSVLGPLIFGARI